MPDSPLAAYHALLDRGEIKPDPAQEAVAVRLDELARRLSQRAPARGLRGLLGGRSAGPVRGLYLHGGVGRGKTMLMDILFGAVRFEPRRRLHFHAFMGEVHERIARARQARDGDAVPHVARDLAAGARLLCLDELQVTDIADAMILARLFQTLLAEGVTVVATSNSAPGELYRDGLNRQLFLPFVGLLEANMDVVELTASRDFRRDKLAGRPLYFVPAGERAREAMRDIWRLLTERERGEPAVLAVKGREVTVPEAAAGVAWLSFAEACGQPLGAADYLAIAEAFHTLFLDGIPVLGQDKRNEARRLVTLIDTLYDRHCRLVVSADAEPDALYVAGDGADLFRRTASRLLEMRSQEYVVNGSR